MIKIRIKGHRYNNFFGRQIQYCQSFNDKQSFKIIYIKYKSVSHEILLPVGHKKERRDGRTGADAASAGLSPLLIH
jgi:hypothetical protein